MRFDQVISLTSSKRIKHPSKLVNVKWSCVVLSVSESAEHIRCRNAATGCQSVGRAARQVCGRDS